MATPRQQFAHAISYKQFTQHRNAAELRDQEAPRTRPLSGSTRLAQVGMNVMEDHLGHPGYAQDPDTYLPPGHRDRTVAGRATELSAVNEYDDILDSLMPTHVDVDYSRYGL
jgi:hypothetical protein